MEEDKADVSLLENEDRCDIFCERNKPTPPGKLLIETLLAKETANTREKGTLDTELWSIILKWNETISGGNRQSRMESGSKGPMSTYRLRGLLFT